MQDAASGSAPASVNGSSPFTLAGPGPKQSQADRSPNAAQKASMHLPSQQAQAKKAEGQGLSLNLGGKQPRNLDDGGSPRSPKSPERKRKRKSGESPGFIGSPTPQKGFRTEDGDVEAESGVVSEVDNA